MDGSIPRIPGARSAQSIGRVHQRGPRDGDAEAFEEQLEQRREGSQSKRESNAERACADVGVREADETGGTLDLTA